jgi:hypothetical protein
MVARAPQAAATGHSRPDMTRSAVSLRDANEPRPGPERRTAGPRPGLARLDDRATGCLLGRENDTETTLREDARALDASDTGAEAINGPRNGSYRRSAALFDRVGRRLYESTPALDARQLAIGDLTLIDGAMARLAEAIGLRITDYDTMAIE